MNDNRQLLVEYRAFEVSKEQLDESLRKGNGELIVSGILTKRDESKNQNGRIYPREVLEREIEKYKKNFIDQYRALGELDHPESSIVNLKNASHNIIEVWWDNDNLMGKVKVLTTPSGNILKELFKCGVKIGISSRALGSVSKVNEDTLMVQEDLELICFDFVSNPSCPGAFLSPASALMEGVSKNKNTLPNNQYSKIEKIIRDILMEVR
jgi:hypothetical protein